MTRADEVKKEREEYWASLDLDATPVDPHNSENHDTWMDAAARLVDNEYCEWRKIGPEDSELFALPKLRVGVKVVAE